MCRLRLSIVGLMATLGLLAADLAVARAAFHGEAVLVIGSSLVALWLQLAVYRLVRRRELRRPFRTAFVFTAAVVFTTFVWAMAFPEGHGLTTVRDPASGRETVQSHTTEGSALWYIWATYAEAVGGLVERRWPGTFGMMESAPLVAQGVMLGVWLLPVAVIASAAGLLGWGFARFLDQDRREVADGAS